MTSRIAVLLVFALVACATDHNPLDAEADTALDAAADAILDGAADVELDAVECEPDPYEPDDGVARATFDAIRNGVSPAYSETWVGTWSSGSFIDIDRVLLIVPEDLAHYLGPSTGTQTWTARATGSAGIRMVITCTDESAAVFTGCEEGIQVELDSCLIEGIDDITVTGDCGRGSAELELIAWQTEDAGCERSLRVEILE